MRSTRLILVAVLILAAAAGCAGRSSSSPTKAPATSTGSTTSRPAGSTAFHTLPTGERGAYTRPASDDLSTALTLHADGRYTQTAPGITIDGVWSFRKGRITFTETGGGDCTGQRGTYRWSYAHKRLTLTEVSDPCPPRSEDFPAAPWRQRH